MKKKQDLIQYGNTQLNNSFITSTSKPRKIETKVIKYEGEGNTLHIASMSHISLPFFTKRKSKRDVNFLYDIGFLGLEMEVTLDSSEKRKVQQPAEFEERIYNFLLQRLYVEYKNSKTKDVITFLRKTPIVFSLNDLLEKLGLSYSKSYSTKLNKALLNLKHTDYLFTQKNKRKADKRYLEFEHRKFSLINYEKFKDGRKVYYRVWLDNPITIEAFEKNLILHFTEDSVERLTNNDSVAERIYKFISMNRFEKTSGECSIIELACIVPYELKGESIKNGKRYIINRTKDVIKKLEKNFKTIVSQGYLKSYKVTDKSIKYVFNDMELGVVTGHSLDQHYKSQNKESISIDEEEVVEAEIVEEDVDQDIDKLILKVKRNIYISKTWNKWAENRIKKLLKEDGYEFTKEVLEGAYNGCQREIETSFVQYLNGVIKRMKADRKKGSSLSKKINKEKSIKKVNKEANKKQKQLELGLGSKKVDRDEVLERKEIPIGSQGKENKNIQNQVIDYYAIYEKMNDMVKASILEQAEEIFLKEVGIGRFTPVHKQIFDSAKRGYIARIMKGEE